MNRSTTVLLLFVVVAYAQRDTHQHSVLSSEYPSSLVREEQTVSVDGVDETWRLQWATTPKPMCGADERDGSLTCPCMGFAYGESVTFI